MHKKIEEIKKNESKPKVLKNIFDKKDIERFLKLYSELPTTTNNKKQRVVKKRWLKGYGKELEKLFNYKVSSEIGDFRMDNLKDEKDMDILGLFQESYSPIGLHVDTGFNLESLIYKQTLVPLTPIGGTVIFKNRFYGNSTTFTQDKNELEKKINFGQNFRSAEHVKMYGSKPFDKKIHAEYLSHEKIENLIGLEVEFIYEWEVGSILIFDRTNLHCASSKIEGKKIGLTTFTKK